MSRVRGTNTGPERLVFRGLRAAGLRFQKHYARAPGKPDIAFPAKKIAVFIDGDFWHGWRFTTWREKLTLYWREKIASNIRRDRRNRARLRRAGWRVLHVWEHQIERDVVLVLEKIRRLVVNGPS